MAANASLCLAPVGKNPGLACLGLLVFVHVVLFFFAFCCVVLRCFVVMPLIICLFVYLFVCLFDSLFLYSSVHKKLTHKRLHVLQLTNQTPASTQTYKGANG